MRWSLRVKDYFANHIRVLSHPAMRGFGFALGVSHLATMLYWLREMQIFNLLRDPALAICWPFFESCYALRPFPDSVLIGGFVLWGLVAVVSMAAFALGTIRLAYFSLLFATLVKSAFFIQDYNLMGNHNYILFVFSFAYLFLPDPQNLLRYLVVACYLAAGILKLQPEWISGASALKRTLISDPTLIRVFASYGAFMELGLSFLLLSRSRWIFYLVFVQFLIFHCFSYQQVGFFFPASMFCVLTILPLLRVWPIEPMDKLNRVTVAALAIFAMGQLLPIVLSSDSAKTAEGRVFALHMVDARLDCEHAVYLKFKDQSIHVQTDFSRFGPRRKCDPLVVLEYARSQCRQYAEVAGFEDLDLYLNVRRQTVDHPSRLVALHDVCKSDVSLHLWRRNSWVLDE